MSNPTPLIICPNCDGPVRMRSEHCRGADELNATWTCTKLVVHDELVEPMTEEQARLFAGAAGGGKTRAFFKAETGIDFDDVEGAERRQFLDALAARLEVGARDYGNASFEKPVAMTSTEILDEALDIAGWAYILWVQLRRRCERLDGATRDLTSDPE